MHFSSAGAILSIVCPASSYEVFNLLRGLLRHPERAQTSILWYIQAGADLPDDGAQAVDVCLGCAISTQQLLGRSPASGGSNALCTGTCESQGVTQAACATQAAPVLLEWLSHQPISSVQLVQLEKGLPERTLSFEEFQSSSQIRI